MFNFCCHGVWRKGKSILLLFPLILPELFRRIDVFPIQTHNVFPIQTLIITPFRNVTLTVTTELGLPVLQCVQKCYKRCFACFFFFSSIEAKTKEQTEICGKNFNSVLLTVCYYHRALWLGRLVNTKEATNGPRFMLEARWPWTSFVLCSLQSFVLGLVGEALT